MPSIHPTQISAIAVQRVPWDCRGASGVMMALYLKMTMKMVTIIVMNMMIIDHDDDDSLPLHGHGKECENGDADSEAGGEGVEAATMFSRSFLVKSLGTCCWACWSSSFRPLAFSQWLKQVNTLTP